MQTFNVEEILRPISPEMPAGDDISYDEDFILLKAKVKSEDEHLLGIWKEKKSSLELEKEKKQSVPQLCFDILKSKSKNIQVVGFLMESLTRSKNLEGLLEGLSLLTEFCRAYWETAHPLPDADDFEGERNKVLAWIDEKIENALHFSPFLPDLIRDSLNFNDLEKTNFMGHYAKNRGTKPSSDEHTKYTAFMQRIEDEFLEHKILPFFNLSEKKVEELRSLLSEKHVLTHDFFHRTSQLLNEMRNFFDGHTTSEQQSVTPENNFEEKEIFVPQSSNRDEIYQKIQSLTEQLMTLDPHSPVPHFIFKTLTWKDKSFIEIVSDLGLNSPLFDFLSQSGRESASLYHDEND